MPSRYELRAVFEVTDAETLLAHARSRHRECYPKGTRYAPPMPDDIADAIVVSLVDCKEGPPPEEFGLAYLESVTGPIDEQEALALDRVRVLYGRTGGTGPHWDTLDKLLEVLLTPPAGPAQSQHGRGDA